MVHDREGLPLGSKALHDRLVVHPRLDQFQRHVASHGGGLRSEPYLPHAAFTQLTNQFIALRK